MRLREAGRQAAALARASGEGARAHGASRLAVARRARRLRRRQAYEYEEALREGLLDPAVPEAVCALHASRHATLEVQRRLNPAAVSSLTGEKAIFYPYCAAVGLPTPELYGVLDVRGAGWSARDGRPIGADAGGFAAFVRGLPGEFVIKPSDGYHGKGVRVLRHEDGRLVDAGGAVRTPAEVLAALRADREFSVHVVQERLHDHPDVARLVGATTLQTLRMVTLVDRRGRTEILYAVMKLAVAGGDSDNFRSGQSGNGLANVDLADGRLGPLRLARPDRCGFVQTPVAPGTGAQVEGAPLPDWGAACDLVREAAPAFLPARTLGWDVALTRRGPVIVEANMFWWPRSTPDQAELLRRLAAS